MEILPNADKAVISVEKFKGYVLNLTHEKGMHKALVFDDVSPSDIASVFERIEKPFATA